MEILAVAPGLLVLLCLVVQSPGAVFLNVYLPTLFLLPDYYRWVLPGAPDPNFHHAAVLPLVVAFLATNASRWRFSLVDFFVFGFAASIGYSEYLNVGYAEAQNLLFDQVGNVVCVYILAKGLIEPDNLRVATAKRIVLLLSVVAVSSVYEFKMAWDPYAGILAPFFPGQLKWVTTFRWGFARVAGPYGHAILAGLMFAVGFRIQRWLEWGPYWETQQKARRISLCLAGGLLMTMCRGPWIGAACGAVVMLVARSNNRRRALLAVFSFFLLVGVPAFLAMKGYLSVSRVKAVSVAQETIAYRRELLEKYVDIMWKKSEWGWGQNTWPRVSTMDSIDNQYLLLPIQHGLVALGFFLLILVWTGARLCRQGVRSSRGSPEGELALTLFAAFFVIAATLTTVYLGTQTVPLFFLLTGWSEGLLLKMRGEQPAFVTVTEPPPLFHFQRVMT